MNYYSRYPKVKFHVPDPITTRTRYILKLSGVGIRSKRFLKLTVIAHCVMLSPNTTSF